MYRLIFNLLNNSRVSKFLAMVRLNLFNELSTTFQLILLGRVHDMLFYPCFYEILNLYAFYMHVAVNIYL